MALAKTCSYNGTGSDNHHLLLPSLIPYEFDDDDEINHKLLNGSSPSTANSNEFLFQSQEEAAHHSLINFRGGFFDSFLQGNNNMNVNNGSLLCFQNNTSSQQKEELINSSNWVMNNDYQWMNLEKSSMSSTTSSDGAGLLENNNNNNNVNNNTASNFTENKPSDWLYSDHHMLTDEPSAAATQHSNFHKRPHRQGESNAQSVKKQCNNASKKPKPKITSPAKDPQSIAAKNRRERISERLKILQELVPNGSKVDLVTMLEKAISYVKFLQLQVKVLATDEFWPVQGGKAPDISQVKDAIDAILHSSQKDGNSSSTSK